MEEAKVTNVPAAPDSGTLAAENEHWTPETGMVYHPLSLIYSLY
jgi:hypothetical protein